MKKLCATLLLLSLVAFGHAQTAGGECLLFSYFTGNGEDGLHLAFSADGYSWRALNRGRSFLTPTAGADKLMRDPCIVQGPDGTFHMVWTVSWGERGIGYAFSKDLIHWSEQRYLPVMEEEPQAKNCWAPELFYDADNKEFLVFWATTITGRFEKGKEQKYNHRIFYTTTKDFTDFSKTALFYDFDFSVIDATILRSQGKYTMIVKDETDKPNTPQKNLRLATAIKAKGPYSRPGYPITGNYWAEGPTALKIGKKWFVYFDKYVEKKYGLVTSTDLADWNDESRKLIMPQGMRHGTAFEVTSDILAALQRLED
jgi:Arabinosidase BT_3657-like, N-terminal